MAEFSNPDLYDFWMGRWSARLAPAFVDFADLPKGGRFLDVGSGTGVLAATLLARVDGAAVVGVEPAPNYVAYSRERMRDERLRFEVGDALDIPFADESFDGALSLLILQELPDALKAVRGMQRVTRPGGTVAASQWDFAAAMPMLSLFWDSAMEVVGTDATLAAAADCMEVDYPDAQALQCLWQEAGLVEVETKAQEVTMAFTSFEDYWAPFLSGVTPTSSFAGKLSGDQRAALMARLRHKVLGAGPERPFTLAARAWSVRGKVASRSLGRVETGKCTAGGR